MDEAHTLRVGDVGIGTVPVCSRFLHSGYAIAIAELELGAKRGHWIWYVFPQLAGLGRSPTAELFAIADIDEAREYLEEPILADRLVEATRVLLKHLTSSPPIAIERLMGSSLDAMKLVSSMTLFAAVSSEPRLGGESPTDVRHHVLADLCTRVLQAAAKQGYPPCAHTTKALSRTTA